MCGKSISTCTVTDAAHVDKNNERFSVYSMLEQDKSDKYLKQQTRCLASEEVSSNESFERVGQNTPAPQLVVSDE